MTTESTNLITIDEITDGYIETDSSNIRSWEGTGIFDVLMNAIDKNIETQYLNDRINGSNYAQVYSSLIGAVLQQAMQFALEKKLRETQIADALAGIAIKEAQLREIEADILLKNEQIKLAYTQRVLTDKQVAMLGLDDVIKTSNITPEAAYTPKYEE